jgi:YaiO family outer membrane protein
MIPIKLNYLNLAFSCLCAFGAHAQDEWTSLDADSAFRIAQQKAFNGERDKAREILYRILEDSPDYHDVRILLARTYAWDDESDSARKELRIVLTKKPDYEDAINAAFDLEMWDGSYEKALEIVKAGLGYHPDSADLLFREAMIFNKLGRCDEALGVLDRLVLLDPDHAKGAALRASIRSLNRKYALRVSYGVDLFSRTFDPAHYSSVQVSRANSWGSSILRLNYSHRFSSVGFQPEIDVYPKIAKGVYAYLNYGYSNSSLFPRHRLGGELYSNLPATLEASAGFRYLYFGSDSKVLIYTGSLGWYFKDYWLSIRPYITPGETGTSFSSSVSLRRYLADGNNYIGFKAGIGYSPDERRIQTGAGLSEDGLYVLKSQNLGLSWQRTFSRDLILDLSYSLTHQELSFDLGQYVWINRAFVGVKQKF